MSVTVPAQLPEPRRRSSRGGPRLCRISVGIEVVTPLLGGGTQTRELDDVDVIRAATVRGHLRFWWRALHGHEFTDAKKLHAGESELWGRAAIDKGGRAAVEVQIDGAKAGRRDDSEIELAKTRGAYALWPARRERRAGRPPAPRREQGTRFQLSCLAPGDRERELRNVLRAWLLFGGYGSRTRRGLGSLRATEDAAAWLPRDATRGSFDALFDRNPFAPPGRAVGDVPWLAGAALQLGHVSENALQAWIDALGWLQEFRQGWRGDSGNRAREPGTGKRQPKRPSISNWPEADKVRRIDGKTAAHEPWHNATPAWPRAGFGLPIVGQFQRRPRREEDTPYEEPGDFELRWRAGGDEYDRLASPLIVKALPLADGRFVPCALWLNRGLPPGAEVGLARPKHDRPDEKEVDSRSAAPFDRLVAPGDSPRFSALAGKASLREAFLDWLRTRDGTTVVAP